MAKHNTLTAEEWLQEQFKDKFCTECGGDAIHHTTVIVMNSWTARCSYPPDKNGNHHHIIQAYRSNLSL